MNTALLAREAASSLGALDPKPEPEIVFQGPTRLERWVFDDGTEIWFDPNSGDASRACEDGIERLV